MVYHFVTDLTKEQIIFRLNTFGDTGLNQIASSKNILYKISGDKLRLIKKPQNYGSSFHRFFYAKMEFKNNKTHIKGKFKLHPFVLFISIAWLSFVIVIGGIVFLGGLSNIFSEEQEIGKTILFIIVPPAMMLGFFGLLKFGRRKQEAGLIEILKEKLEFKQIEKSI